MGCPISGWFLLRSIEEKIEGAKHLAVYEVMIGRVKDYLSGLADEVSSLAFDGVNFVDTISSAICNTVMGIAQPQEWVMFASRKQLDVALGSAIEERNDISSIVNTLERMQYRIKDRPANNKRLSELTHRWLSSAYNNLENAKDRNSILYFSTSKRRIVGLESLLSFNKNKKITLGLIDQLGVSLDKASQGDPIRKKDFNDELSRFLQNEIDEVRDSLDFLIEWRFFIEAYVSIFRIYTGGDISNLSSPLIKTIDKAILAMDTGAIPDMSSIIADFSSWNMKLVSFLSNPIMNNDTLLGSTYSRKGAISIVSILAKLLTSDNLESVRVKEEVQKKITEIQKLDAFKQILGDSGFTATGLNKKGALLINNRGDRLNQANMIRSLLREYNLAEQRTMTAPDQSITSITFKAKLENALIDLEQLSSIPVREIYPDSIYGDMTVSKFEIEADAKGSSFLLMLAGKVLAGHVGNMNLANHINFFKTRLAISNAQIKIIETVPEYENVFINEAIDELRSLNFDTLADNLEKGAQFTSLNVGSIYGAEISLANAAALVGTASEAFGILDEVDDCFHGVGVVAKAKAKRALNTIKLDISRTVKEVKEKGVDSILGLFGSSVDYIKDAQRRIQEIDDKANY